MFYDMVGDGYQHRTAWAAAGNAVLVLDEHGDGQITQKNQVVFTEWDPTATSDMQALRDVFDTNHDGKLDAGDAQFASFKLLVTNADGSTTLETLAQAGISSIDLSADMTSQFFADGSSIDGESKFTRTDGTTGTAATMTLAYDQAGYALQTTTSVGSDGSRAVDTRTLDASGALAGEVRSVMSADGLTRTVSTDSNGDGVFDDVERDVTTLAADGSRTDSLRKTNAAGVLQIATTTTTSADGRSITITRDNDGNGVADQSESDVTYADGSKSTVVTNVNADGSAIDRTVHLTSADGLTGTTLVDADGDGVYDTTEVDALVLNSDGSRSETITDTNADGSLRDRTAKVTTSGAAYESTQVDVDGDGTYDINAVSSITHTSDGGTTIVVVDLNANQSVRDVTVTTKSADGLSTVTQSDPDGNGSFDTTHSDKTAVNADGSRTETIKDTNVQGTLLDETVIAKGADGVSRTTFVDSHGSGHFDTVDQISVGADGSKTETLSHYQLNGSTLENRTTTVTSADGLTQTIAADNDGDGKVDLTTVDQTIKNANGSTQTDRALLSGSGALLELFTTYTSADGLSTISTQDLTGDGTPEYITISATTVNGDGSRTNVTNTTSTNGTLLSSVVSTISADRNTTTISYDDNGDGATDRTEIIAKSPNGTITDTSTTFSPSGAELHATVVSTSADGLFKTTSTDLDGNGTIDARVQDSTVLNANGSRTETIATYGPISVLLDKTVIVTSANGLSNTIQDDVDGNGTIDKETDDVTVLNNDGSKTETVSQHAGSSLVSRVVTTTSSNGLTIDEAIDSSGSGTFDTTRHDVTTLNADGSKTETLTEKNANGSTRDQLITITSADRKTSTASTYLDGSTSAAMVVHTTLNADGSTSKSIQDEYDTISENVDANGLNDSTSSGTYYGTRTTSHETTFNSGGSETTALNVNDQEGYDLKQQILGNTETINVSENGLMKTYITSESDDTLYFNVPPYKAGDPPLSSFGSDAEQFQATDKKTIAADGSTSELITETGYGGSGNNTTETKSMSADGRTQTTSISSQGNPKLSDTISIGSDGSQNDDRKVYTGTNLAEEINKTVNGNGMSTVTTRDSNGDGIVDARESVVTSTDGGVVDSVTTTGTLASGSSSTVTTTSADGRSITTQFDFGGDGTADVTNHLTATLNADGSVTRSNVDAWASGTKRDGVVTTTSANGLSVMGTIDLDGDGDADETFSDVTVLGNDGSKTRTVQTHYSDGTLSSKTVIATSADGYTVTSTEDIDGDGNTDFVEETEMQPDGAKDVHDYYMATSKITDDNTSADGKQSYTKYNYTGNSSRQSDLSDGFGSFVYSGNGTQQAYYFDVIGADSQQQAENIASYDRAYDTVFDRDPSLQESHDAYLDKTPESLISSLIGSGEFSQRYGSMSNAQFVEQMYQNALERSASIDEEQSWLQQIANGTSLAAVAYTISESAEHLADGNGHAVTNNTLGNYIQGKQHTLDKSVAGAEVERVFQTVLDRSASASELASNASAIVAGSSTASQIADQLTKSSEFASDFGSLSNTQYVDRMFDNKFGQGPSAQEEGAWTQMLGSGAISRADFAVAVADSAADSGGLNRLVQAMAQFAPATSADPLLAAVQAVVQEPQLASAHA